MRPTPNIPEPVRAALAEVLDYLWDAEKEDIENEPREGHIFLSLRAVSDWLAYEPSGVKTGPERMKPLSEARED